MSSLKLYCKTTNGEDCEFKSFKVTEDGGALILTVEGTLPKPVVEQPQQKAVVEKKSVDDIEDLYRLAILEEPQALLWSSYLLYTTFMFSVVLLTMLMWFWSEGKVTIKWLADFQYWKFEKLEIFSTALDKHLIGNVDSTPKIDTIDYDGGYFDDTVYKAIWNIYWGIDIILSIIITGIVSISIGWYDTIWFWVITFLILSVFIPRVVYINTVTRVQEAENSQEC